MRNSDALLDNLLGSYGIWTERKQEVYWSCSEWKSNWTTWVQGSARDGSKSSPTCVTWWWSRQSSDRQEWICRRIDHLQPRLVMGGMRMRLNWLFYLKLCVQNQVYLNLANVLLYLNQTTESEQRPLCDPEEQTETSVCLGLWNLWISPLFLMVSMAEFLLEFISCMNDSK